TWSEVIDWPLLKLSAETDAVLGSCRSQELKLPSTKSESVAVGLCDERVSAMKVEKQASQPKEVRVTPSSRNSPGRAPFPGVLLLLVKDHGSVTFDPLTIANVLRAIGLPLLRATRLPVASSPTHSNTRTVETEPPWVKSLTRRMSPVVCVPVKGCP